MNSDLAYDLRPDLVVTTLEHEAVVLDLETKFFFSINPSGWAIGELFETGATPAQALEACRQAEAPATIEAQVQGFIATLIDEGLLTPADHAAAEPRIQFAGPWEAPTVTKHREPLQQVVVSAFDPTLPLAE